MKIKGLISFFALAAMIGTPAAATETILFVGNSFTYGAYSPVQHYRPDIVTDLNGEGIGGVPALFEIFTRQAGLDFEVSLETGPGKGFDFHLSEKRAAIGKPWDHVILQGLSLLDAAKPGDAQSTIVGAEALTRLFHGHNPKAQIRLTATWSRADQVYQPAGHWYGKPIEAMALDIRRAYDLAAAQTPAIRGVIPVGQAWTRAMQAGVADPNPYDGIAAGQVDLWAYDHYHGSSHGYYLEALTVFGSVTGKDPRILGEREQAAAELGISPAQAKALQQAAYETLAAESPSPLAPPTYGRWGLEPGAARTDVRAGDDFYSFAQGTAVAAMDIPSDRPRQNWFSILDDLSRSRQKAILEEAAQAKAPDALGRFYAAFMDEGRIEALGRAPLETELRRVRTARDHGALAALMGEANGGFTGSLFQLRIRADARDPDRYSIQLLQGGLSLPDRDYYFDPRYADDVAKFETYVGTMLGLAGWADPASAAKAVVALETEVAKASWSRVESLDPARNYHPATLAELEATAPGFAWRRFFAAAGLKDADQIVMAQDSAIARLAALFARTPPETLRAWQAFSIADNAADVLPMRFREARFAFRDRAIQGTPAMAPRWKNAVLTLDRYMSDALNRRYVERHLPPTTRRAVAEMLANLEKAAAARIDTLDRMGPETRREAHAKMQRLLRKVGAPDSWRDYAGLDVDGRDAFGNLRRGRAFDWDMRIARRHDVVDRSEWQITPALVDATYNGSRNEVLLTAAMMQPPFFDPAADPAANYGAIGAIIGHELSHAFDTIGRRYDAAGAVRDWWTAKDDALFKAEATKLGAQYSRYEPLPGFPLNGELTMAENIADLGGVVLALDAYHLSLGGKPAPVIDGLTGDQRFFLAFAQIWRSRQRDETARLRILLDSHAAEEFRVNGVVRNIDAWYKAFAVGKSDRLYVAPEERVRIW
ncbi:MAG: M13 family metallopeptidase [Sphingomonadales bacterium]|nr:M13 family metallopeptidase [Sphingomonadales bacterium]